MGVTRPEEEGAPTQPRTAREARGALVVVGTGIQWAGQTTLAARRAIEVADRVLFAVGDAGTAGWLRSMRPDAVSLRYSDGAGGRRRNIYREMVGDILAEVRLGRRVCAVFYGHPGVFSSPAHEAVRAARHEGLSARMLPGVSFLDCLFVDLGVDPVQEGCAMYEATDFLLRRRPFDVHTSLVLSQVALIGNPDVFDAASSARIQRGLAVLRDALCARYPQAHEAIVYEASTHPIEPPRIERVRLGDLGGAAVTEVSTLFVPPVGTAPVDEAMRAALSQRDHVSSAVPSHLADARDGAIGDP